MGYRSEVYLKTTTEGYIVLKQFNDSIPDPHEQFLDMATIEMTPSGFYKITFHGIKWYDSYQSVQNFHHGLDNLEKSGIPYKFIRLGEEVTDIEILENYTDDMPDEIVDFVVEVDAYDPDAGLYKEIEEGGE